MTVWWTQVDGTQLAQGDLVSDCLLPLFAHADPSASNTIDATAETARLIVVTQSCDLENNKVSFVALCPVFRLDEFEEVNPEYRKKGAWENVRKGRVEGLHLLASTESPSDNRESYVVDFGHIVSLPFAYLCNHADSLGQRWRLNSPFLEHFSQAFARFFMRVGLPTVIAPFK